MGNVLIIDDDEAMCKMLCDFMESINHSSEYALTLEGGIKAVESNNFDLVLLDVKMPDGNGLDVIQTIRSADCSPEIVVITGAGDPEGAEQAIRHGAWDYIVKPISPQRIMQPISQGLAYRKKLKARAMADEGMRRDGIVGESPALRQCLGAIQRAARSDANVLIVGETGTGKELFSRALHLNSARASKPFVVIDCASLPESLTESSLFGYEKGAFTGAQQNVEGLVKQADGGTLFLDEIGELSLNQQKVFLRVLQERSFRPIGGKQEIKSNFRLICATNRDLEQMVERGLYRKDLLYRLRSISIQIPALRERVADIEMLATCYAAQIFSRYKMAPKVLSAEFLETLKSYKWPGNIRGLINALEESICNAQSEKVVFPHHLPRHIRIEVTKVSVNRQIRDSCETDQTDDSLSRELPTYKRYREDVLASADRTYLRKLMASTRGNIKDACRTSGLGRTRLYTLLKKCDVSRTGWYDDDQQ